MFSRSGRALCYIVGNGLGQHNTALVIAKGDCCGKVNEEAMEWARLMAVYWWRARWLRRA